MKTKGSKNTNESLKFRRLSLKEKYQSIISFYKDKNRLPKTYPKPDTEHERVRGQFIINKKSALKRGELPADEQKLLNTILSFNETKLTRTEYLVKIKNFVSTNKRAPRYGSKNSIEKKLASHWYNISAIVNKSKSLLSDNEYLLFMDISDLIDEIKPKRIDKMKKLLNYCKTHNRTPRRHITDEAERKMANLFTTMKQNLANHKLSTSEVKVLDKIMEFAPPSRNYNKES